MWRPEEGWRKNPCDGCSRKVEDEWGLVCNLSCGEATAYSNYEVGADAVIEKLKGRGLHGEYLKDFMISVAVKKDNPDWAEPFFSYITDKGWLIFIPEDESAP